MSTADPVTCYACGHEYRHLGRGLHPGRCPECASNCVSQAGELTVVTDVDVSPSEMPPRVTVMAIDERYRHFLYHFSSEDAGLSLSALQVDGHLVCPPNKPWEVDVPEQVEEALSRAEYLQYPVCE